MKHLLTATAAALALAAGVPASAQNLVISNARIIVGDGQVIEKGSVVVDGRQDRLGAAGAARRPPRG